MGEGLDPEVNDAVMKAAKVLEEKGAIVEAFDLRLVKYAILAIIRSQMQRQVLTWNVLMV